MNPIKPSLRSEIIPVLVIVTTSIAAFYFYSHFPDRVPTHWNFEGEVDGWSSRSVGAFLIPAILVGMYLLFLTMPFLDPKKDRYIQFRKPYHVFKGVFIFFMALIYFAASLSGLGYDVPIGSLVPFLIGILFVVIGNYLSKIKPNWFMGIRTPWTLSSEAVWTKTHRFGAKAFFAGGFGMMIMGFLPPVLRGPLFIALVLVMSLGTMAYSYYLYSKEQKKKNGENNQSAKPTD